MIAGSHGLTYEATTRAAERLAGAEKLVLPDYAAPGWADVIADRTDAVTDRMTDFLARHADDTARPPAREGAVADRKRRRLNFNYTCASHKHSSASNKKKQQK